MEEITKETSKTPSKIFKNHNDKRDQSGHHHHKNKGSSRRRFLGVRQRPSGRWVAEIKDSSQKLRLWLGTFDQEEEAALAYDSAARVLRGKNAKTNFPITNNSCHNNNEFITNHTLLRKNPRLCQLLQQAIIKKINHARSLSCIESTKDPSFFENYKMGQLGECCLNDFDALVEETIVCSSSKFSAFGLSKDGASSSSNCCSKVYSSVVVAPSFSVGEGQSS